MMLSELIEQELKQIGVNLVEWQELLLRLLNYGVLCRDENQTERELYDRFVRCEGLVNEYLAFIGIGLHHDRRFCFIRVYPPGAQLPGMAGAEESSFTGALRERLTQQEVALLLVLRVQYDKAVREGRITDHGAVKEPLEAIGIAMKNLLGRPLPENKTERRTVLQRLKKLRLINFPLDDDLSDAEAVIIIHPMIVDFVTGEALTALQASSNDVVNTTTVQESSHVS